MHKFLPECWALNLGRHACLPNTLPTELPPQPLMTEDCETISRKVSSLAYRILGCHSIKQVELGTTKLFHGKNFVRLVEGEMFYVVEENHI